MSYKITESCIGCGICFDLCPVSAISGVKKSIYHINAERCVKCDTCGKACPKGAIKNDNEQVIKSIPKKEWVKPIVDKAVCSACGICVDVCGKHAMKISHPVMKGDYKVFATIPNYNDCVGCGVCERECPMQAIQMEVPSC